MVEEKRIEYTYKQKELNKRIKQQIVWPLECLENESKLADKMKEIKKTQGQLTNLENDFNFTNFLQQENNKLFLKNIPNELQDKA